MTETRFGDYQLLEQIGAGGMAAVYRANDPTGERVVALKVLHKHWATDHEFVRRFQREAEIAGQLHHRHIVPIYDYGKSGDRPYITMQLMPGGSLAQLFRRPARLSLSISARILTQIASALDFAHQRGVVHRDLKLENILLDDQNRPLLADFGIARAMDATRLTATGQVTGTPLYMSPEQARGESNLSYSTDIYSLAVMAYLLATGFFPFSGSVPLVLLNQHLTMIPPTPSLVNPDLSPALDVVLLKGLAKTPSDRYASAGEFALAYTEAIADSKATKIYIVTTQPNPVLPPLANSEGGSSTLRFDENGIRSDTVVLEEEPIPSPVVTAQETKPMVMPTEERERRRKSPILFALTTLILLLFGGTAYVLSRNQTPVGEIVPEMTEEGDNSVGGRGDGNTDLSDNTQNSSGDGVRGSPTSEYLDARQAFGATFEAILNAGTPTPTGTLTTTVSASTGTTTGTPSGTPATATPTKTKTKTATPGASPTLTRTRTPLPPTNTRTNTPIPASNTPVPPPPPTNTPVPPPPTDPPPAPTNPPPPPPTNTPDNPLIPPLVETLLPPLCGLLPC